MENKYDQIIKLNVGGARFETLLSTLTSGSSTFFTNFFSEKYSQKNAIKDENGYLFLCRDRHCFKILLRWMRDQEMTDYAGTDFLQLAKEAEYFGMYDLLESMTGEKEYFIKFEVSKIILTLSANIILQEKESLLAKCLSEEIFPKSVKGRYIIDRPYKPFRTICNFLKTGYLDKLPKNYEELRELILEAKYYQLSNLSKFLSTVDHTEDKFLRETSLGYKRITHYGICLNCQIDINKLPGNGIFLCCQCCKKCAFYSCLKI